MSKHGRILVAMSGGIDSSLAAVMLHEEGYEVIGMTMKTWDYASSGGNKKETGCCSLDSINDARNISVQLGFPHYILDIREEFGDYVIDHFTGEYLEGRTPNPCVLCNTHIKWNALLKRADSLDCEFIATGHYAEVRQESGRYVISTGLDNNKDQSYFLCQLSQEQLSKALFPIGELTKPQVREIATAQGLITAQKKDSQGLCFIGKVRLPEFLQQKLQPKQGLIIEVDSNHSVYHQESPVFNSIQEQLIYESKPVKYNIGMGKIVGKHQGAHYFTNGQRKGLNVGGTKEALFVIATDVQENVIYTGQGHEHPGLFRKALFIKKEEVHWIRTDLQPNLNQSIKVLVRIRYRQSLQQAELFVQEEGVYILFETPQSAITPGQFAAWYVKDELIGSGVIAE